MIEKIIKMKAFYFLLIIKRVFLSPEGKMLDYWWVEACYLNMTQPQLPCTSVQGEACGDLDTLISQRGHL